MKWRVMKSIISLSFVLFFAANLSAREVKWQDLGDYDLEKKKAGASLKKILGKKVSIVGSMIPLEHSGKNLKEFLLLMYYPSCPHVPVPAPHQIIKVTVNPKKKVQQSYYNVKVTGVLKLIKNKKKKEDSEFYIPQGIYSMVAQSVEELKN